MIEFTADEIRMWKNDDCPYLKQLKSGKWACSKLRFFECEMFLHCKVVYKKEVDDK